MWFGTYDGLNRYDGYEFKVFRNKLNDTNSLLHNYIYAINEDHENNLWIATGKGISIYNNLTSKFLPSYYISGDNGKKIEKISSSTNTIKTDAKGNVFIGTNGGGLIIRHKNNPVAIQLLFKKGINETADYNVQAIAIDKKQRVWLFILDVGLCMYDRGQIRLVNNNLKAAQCLEIDDRENIWIGTNNGLYKYNILSNSLIQSYNEQTGKLTSNNIASLCFDKQRNLWIGTEGGGINILNTANGQLDYILPGESKNTLTSESVFAIFEDKESRKWMGTLKGGINIIDPQKSIFKTIAHDPLNRNSLIYNFASSFYEDNDKNLWIGTDGGGLSIWNRQLNSFKNFSHEGGNPRSLSNNLVSCIRNDHQNNVWIATFGGGINRFNKATHSFERFRCVNDATGYENKNAWLIYEDRDKNLWVTTFGRGKLYRYNPVLNRFEAFDQQLNDLIALTEDRSGTLWAGNSYQLVKIDKQNKKHRYYLIDKPVRSIYEDKKGNFWIGAEGGGLILFNRQQGKITARYSDANGLCNNAVLNILEDSKGHLWLSTFNGLSEFDPVKKAFRNFYQADGLQSNQFLYNAALRLQSGELVFGGIKGFNIFHPDSIRTRNTLPVVLLTGLRVNNVPVTSNDPYITKISGDQIRALRIPYDKAVLSLDFAALEYSAPSKIRYAYFLEGWDKGWNYTGRVRTANYTNLREGNYLLRIKSTNVAGAWGNNEINLKITVLPPWYRSWWAYLLYFSIIGSLVYLYLRYRTQQTRLEYEVKLAHLTIEKEKELNEKKLSFFTDISHEFRTPLTLIINPLKDLLYSKEKKVDNGDLNIVYRNARRLLSLVDQLLLFRKAGTEEDKLKIVKLNFYNVCKEVYLSFVNQAKSKKMDYSFVGENEMLEIYGDREKIEIILYNLLSNALKFTPEGGKVALSINETADEVAVIVSDNGPGIPPEVGSRLFERFYQVPDTRSPAKPGFGIGLYLVKHFVEKHKGKILYESQPGQGTAFKLMLQKGKEHFNRETIFEDVPEKSGFLETLPADEPVAEVEKVNIDELVSSRKSMLVVEDNIEVRHYVTSIFTENFDIYEAQSGEEGLKLAQQYLPDIIISDVMMQNGTGIELCSLIKETPELSHIPVILLTGISSAEIKLKGVECGADDYITKPFEKELLVARVDSILKSRTHLQKYFYNEITLKKHDLKISSEYKEFLERCIAIVENHLDDNDFNIKKLALEIGMSHSNLYRRVKSISGQSISGFIRFIRLRKAAELMIKTNCNVNEAAYQVGISDIKYFRRQFNRLFGMNPSEYIKKFRSAFNKNYTLNEKIKIRESHSSTPQSKL